MLEKILIELESKDKEMDGFQFVLRSMFANPGKGDLRCAAHCIKIKDSRIIGTDGDRCHIYKTEETYKDGYYRVLKRLKTDVILMKVDESDYKVPFPKTYDELFEITGDAPIPISADLFDSQYVVSYTKIIRGMKSWQTLHPDFVKALDNRFDVTILDDRVVFVGMDRKACITPITTDMEA